MDQEQFKTYMTNYARNYNERRERRLRRLEKHECENVSIILIGIITAFLALGKLIYDMHNIVYHVVTGLGFTS